jgi:uncharacterized iron-regulated membrane protein
MSKLRRTIEWLHLYSGLAAAPLLLMLGLTGSYLTFEYPIDRLLNPGLNYVHPQPAQLSLDRLVAVVRTAHPEARVVSIALSPYLASPDLAYTAQIAIPGKPVRTVYLDQYAGRILGEQSGHTVSAVVHDLHTNLLTGEDGPGSVFLMVAAALLVVLSITGMLLWWPRKILSVNWSASSRRIVFDLHNALGFYAFTFMLLFGVTGVIVHWQSIILPVTNRALHITDAEPEFHSKAPSATANHQTLDDVACTAALAVPGARVTQISLPNATGIYRIWMKYPEDSTPLGRTNLLIDPYSGAVLWERTSRSAPATTRFFRQWNRELHTGDLLGWPGKILMCLMSLTLPVLAVTGPLFWFRKRRKVRPARLTAVAPGR